MKISKVSPASIRTTLERRDFLTDRIDVTQKQREHYLVVHIAGTKGSGKSRATDTLYGLVQAAGHPAITSRASTDAEQSLSNIRREMLKRQEDSRGRWHLAVAALREEGRSALERAVLPFIIANANSPKKGVVFLHRYPLVDTLARQSTLDSPLSGVAQYLRGLTKQEPSGYIRPDINLVFVCHGEEAVQRITYRAQREHDRGEKTAALGPNFAEETDRLIREYFRIAGYNPSTREIDGNKKATPGAVYVIDTGSEGRINYETDQPQTIDEALARMARENASRIFNDILLPVLANGGKR